MLQEVAPVEFVFGSGKQYGVHCVRVPWEEHSTPGRSHSGAPALVIPQRKRGHMWASSFIVVSSGRKR